MPDQPTQDPQEPREQAQPQQDAREQAQQEPREQEPREETQQEPREQAQQEPREQAHHDAPGQAQSQREPRPVTRPADDRVVAGVASGLARYFALDPIIVRIAFVLLAAAGGIGLVAYLAGWVLMPVEGREGEQRGRTATIVLALLLVLVAAPLLAEPFFGFSAFLVFLAMLGGAGYLLWRLAGGRGGDRPLVAAGLGLLVLAAALIGATLVGIAAAALGAGTWLAVALIVCGAALAVGAFYGGARWLILPALLVAIPLALVAAADLEIDGPVGERYHRVVSAEQAREGFEIGMGDMRVDLSAVSFPPGATVVPVGVGLGNASVLVPAGVCVASDLDLGIGHADVLGSETAGIDLEEAFAATPSAAGDPPLVVIAADIGLGNVEVLSERDAHLPSFFESDRRPWMRGSRWTSADHPQLTCDSEQL